MIGSSELNIKTGDWAGLRNGEMRGPVTVSEDKSDQFPVHIKHDEFFFSWALDGRESDNGGKSSFDIVAVLPCAPLERIRQLEEQRAEQWRQRREAEASRDVEKALSYTFEKRIRQLEEALRGVIKDLNMRGKPLNNGKGKTLDISHGVLQTALAVLEASQ